MRKFVLSVLLVSFAIAGVLYHFAAQAPDGLEKTMENLGAEEADHLVPSLFPDYEFPLLGRVAGKTVAGVARITRAEGVPVIAVAGSLGQGWERVLKLGVEGVEPIVPRSGTLEEAMARPAEMLAATTERAVNGWLRVRAIAGRRDE